MQDGAQWCAPFLFHIHNTPNTAHMPIDSDNDPNWGADTTAPGDGTTNPGGNSPTPTGGGSGGSSGDGSGGWVATALKTIWPFVKGIVKGWSFSGHSAGYRRWQNAGPGVHAWFTQWGPQSFLDYMDANHPDGFSSLEQVLTYMPAWALTNPNGSAFLIMRNGYGISDPRAPYWYILLTEDAYRDLGIDYQATAARIIADGRNNLTEKAPILLPNGVIPQSVYDAAQRAADAANAGTATTDQADLLAALLSGGTAFWNAAGQIIFDPNGTNPQRNEPGATSGQGLTPRSGASTASLGLWGAAALFALWYLNRR